MSDVRHITEIVPANMPEWAEAAIDEGKFFNIALVRVEALEKDLASARKVIEFYGVEDNHKALPPSMLVKMRSDGGKQAREWLGLKDEQETEEDKKIRLDWLKKEGLQ